MAAFSFNLKDSNLYKAVELYDWNFHEMHSNDLEENKLVGLAAMMVISNYEEESDERTCERWLRGLPGISDEQLFQKQQLLLEICDSKSPIKTFMDYLHSLIAVFGGLSVTNVERRNAVFLVRDLADKCLLENECRDYSPLALAGAVYYWYARGEQAPWISLISSNCTDMKAAVIWVIPLVKEVDTDFSNE